MCGGLQYLSMFVTGVAYVITTATCMRAIQKSNCYHREGSGASCAYGNTFYMLLFGSSQIFFSQIPAFHKMEWLSTLATIMSFFYASIGIGLGAAKVAANGWIKGSISGVPTHTTPQKVWTVFQALGDIAFAYPYSLILIEIQDTLKSTPPESKTMKRASMFAILITTFFYLLCGGFGYAAFGDLTPGNLLTGFGFYEPYWLVDFANACVVVHLIGGYQVYSQPIFAFVEKFFAEKFPKSGFINNAYPIRVPLVPEFGITLFRICFRTAYVLATMGMALLFPYFNQILALLGALNFWPLAIYFPVEMYIVQKKIDRWTRRWVFLKGFSIACLFVSVVALVGCIEGLVTAKLG
ncbi:hypothetical protein Scep_003622 [Stephania cephalantha]|uniref:Amino acid transporter transmembrane domain-containing protein n=1 Tax=Stephania cephalantha TaxID=152367 RepID=A0AAP0KQV2_9MAGN